MINNKYGLDLEIGDLWYNPFWKTSQFYAIVSITLFSLLFYFIYKLFYFKKNKTKDPIILLINALNASAFKVGNISAQSFYFDLVNKIKQFILYKYEINLNDKTDHEIKNLLKQDQIDHELRLLLLDILDTSYLVRFAKNEIDLVKIKSHLKQTIALMQKNINKIN